MPSKPQPGGQSRARRSTKQNQGQPVATWQQWSCLALVVMTLPYLFGKLHYSLPAPKPPSSSMGPQPSEELVLGHIQALETIGYRTVGTPQARRGEVYVEEQVRALQRRCKDDGVLQCDVWIQTGDGFHEFTIMDHDVLKVYKGISNVILRIRAHNPPTGRRIEKDAILLGSHIDSTLPAPGAADDGMGVGVMLDIARVLVDRRQPFDNTVLFVWNGGEETLQDGSHLFSTRHETAKEVRAVINLEAAGTTGGGLLFQATSKEMIEAFAHAPRPRGSVIAADVFASGVLMSDTDFGQFERYLNVSGLDMAIVGHSYFYHTQKDRIEFIEKGSAQHFADNVMAIVDHLTSSDSPLHSEGPWSPPRMVYVTLYDRIFLMWSMETATKIYSAIGAVTAVVVGRRTSWSKLAVMAVAAAGTILGIVGGLISANAVAGIMVLLDKRLAWFKHEHLCLVLYAPAGWIGYFGTQHFLSRWIAPSDVHLLERAHYHAQLVSAAVQMALLQFLGVRSAYIFAFITGALLLGALGHEAVSLFGTSTRRSLYFGPAYGVTIFSFIILGVEAVTTTLDIFAPLTGRIGKEAPAEFIIATLSAVCTFTFVPPLVPLFHRFSSPGQKRILGLLVIITASVMVIFAGPWWKTYDSMHPKRAGVQYTYNHTTSRATANIAFMDSGPELDFVQALHSRYGMCDRPVEKTVMNKDNADWDVLYPVSSFLDTYRFDLAPKTFEWPEMGVKVKEEKSAGRRTIDMSLDFTGLVWPTLAFNAEILDWSFDFVPPEGHRRHHVKIATSVDTPVVDMSFTIVDTGLPLSMHWIAIDLNQMVPGTAREMGPDMPGSKMLLDVQEWAKEKYEDSLEILSYAAVAGIVDV